MSFLFTKEDVEKIDKKGAYLSAEALNKQCLDGWNTAKKVHIPEEYKQFTTVILSGMGGSGLGGRIIDSLYGLQSKVPIINIHDYNLPAYADNKTLVICSSYSGNTEEVLETLKQAREKKCKIVIVASGGELETKAQELGVPFYKIVPEHNPSEQPRMAIGYSLFGQLALADSLGIITVEEEELTHAVNVMKGVANSCAPEVDYRNPAKSFVSRAHNKMILFISGEHLVGPTHVFNNQTNENAKTLSFDTALPELNHHLMEGLTYPKSNHKNIIAFLVDSEKYSPKIRKRLSITKDVLSKQGIDCFELTVKGPTKLSEAMSLIQFGMYASTYLAVMNKQDPAPIPWVNYFKEKLNQ